MSSQGQPGSSIATKPSSTTPVFQSSVQKQVFNQTSSLLRSVLFRVHLSGRDEAADALRSAEKFSETGEIPQSLSPTPEGVGLPRAITIPSWLPKTVTEQAGGVSRYIITERIPPFLTPLQIPSWGPPLGCTLLQNCFHM